MRICVMTDDAASFSKEEINKLGIKVLRMPIIIDGEVFFEDETISKDEFYSALCNGKDCSTSQPSPGEVMTKWQEILKDYDAIIHIPMSSGLSNTCATAKSLAEDLEFANKIFVVDNHRIEPTLKESVREAVKLVEAGKSPKEIKEILEKEGPNSSIYIMVNTLTYLKKGGRITPAAALLGGALHIKPILSIYGSKLDAYTKTIGTKKARLAIIEAIKKDMNDKFKDVPLEDLTFSVAYAENKEECLDFKRELEEAIGVKDIEINTLSCLIITHVGPGVLAATITKKIKA